MRRRVPAFRVSVLALLCFPVLVAAADIRRAEVADAIGKVVGTALQPGPIGSAIVVLDTQWGPLKVAFGRYYAFSAEGIDQTIQRLYTTTDCTGTQYVSVNQLWKSAWVDNASPAKPLWVGDPATHTPRTIKSVQDGTFSTPTACSGDLGGASFTSPVETLTHAFDVDTVYPSPYTLAFVSESAFHPLSPCRLFDTRDPGSFSGGAPLSNPGPHSFAVQGNCGVPQGATGVAINLTVTQPSTGGDIRLFPASAPPPAVNTSAINFASGQTIANAQVIPLGVQGTPGQDDVQLLIGMVGAGTVHVIVDITGYLQ